MKDKEQQQQASIKAAQAQRTSRIPRFYRLSVERRLAHLQRAFGLSNDEVARLRDGSILRIEHAVNMVENAIGVFGLPLGLGLNFLVDGREFIVPMAIEEASIIAAVSKSALIIRGGGGFTTEVDDPVMIGQVQLLGLADAEAAAQLVLEHKAEVIASANLPGQRMVERGGGVFDLECRVLDDGDNEKMLIVHLLMDVCEAMGANAVNSACEAAAPVLAEITGGRFNLRILSNLADRRLARARFRLPLARLATADLSGEEVGRRMLEAGRLAHIDPYRAATHNKGIFNGIGAAAVALGQDWRAIEAGGHAYAARDGQYRGLTEFHIKDDVLVGSIELPMPVGMRGGAVRSHPGVGVLRKVCGVETARELAGLLAAVGLAQTFGANLALCTVGIQQGHMALHARSVALSAGVPAVDVERVARAMLECGDVKVASAEKIHGEIKRQRERREPVEELPIEASAPGKVVLFGEHAVVYGHPGITASIDAGVRVRISHDPDGPRFVMPQFQQLFPVEDSDHDFQRFARAVDVALTEFNMGHEPVAIAVESDMAPGMGLGSSASFSVALCRALMKYRGAEASDNELLNSAQRLEAIFHGTPSGVDAATVISGGVLWFRKGPPREMVPVRMPRPAAGLVCIVEPGTRTIELVRQVRHSYEMNEQRVTTLLDGIGEITAAAATALGSADFALVGELMDRNHELLMRLGVSTPGLDRAVERLREQGVLGAKLTGAGGGGAVVALVAPEQRHVVISQLEGELPLVLPFDLGATT